MLIVSTTDAHRIGDEYESEDGVFDVPHELGQHLLAFPGWRVPTEDEYAARESTAADESPAPRTRSRSRKS